jgi:hypothetical protein
MSSTASLSLPAAGYSVADLCRRWKVGPDKIHGFLRRGELIGVNVATCLSAKPQWRITPESVAQFEQRRKSALPPKPPRQRRRPPARDFIGDALARDGGRQE